jgi:hypothetical protein
LRRPEAALWASIVSAEGHFRRSSTELFESDTPRNEDPSFGGVSQYGTLFPQEFLIFGGGGATHSVIDDFQNNLGTNPCPA